MRLVLVESPFAGDVETNVAYAKKACLDCLWRGEAPYASHLFYTQMLDDKQPAQRAMGIHAGLVWGEKADATIVYCDRGVSKGMRLGIQAAIDAKRPIEYRSLEKQDHVEPNWREQFVRGWDLPVWTLDRIGSAV